MAKSGQCVVEGCPSSAHAKGYCRRHYGQIWRRGMIYNETPRDQTSTPESGMRRDDRLKALEREFRKAQQMYEVVVGFQGRIKWRREMEAVQYEIRKLTDTDDLPPPSSPKPESGLTAAIRMGTSGESAESD